MPIYYHGVTENVCHKCGNGITGSSATAVRKTCHLGYCLCWRCKREATAKRELVEKGRKPFYEINLMKVTTGAQCVGSRDGNYIVEEVIFTDDGPQRKWYPECLRCTECNKPLYGDKYEDKDGKPYCKKDFEKMFPEEKKKFNKGKGCQFTVEIPTCQAMGHMRRCCCFDVKGCQGQPASQCCPPRAQTCRYDGVRHGAHFLYYSPRPTNRDVGVRRSLPHICEWSSATRRCSEKYRSKVLSRSSFPMICYPLF
ncbi:paxillin homolog 1-like [Ptychodera flava]|uniref:paxillin homolog 1-like n=1 Tax=Ptychodera flava TaxID=63121 RepID=UPI00396A74AD